MGSISEIDLAFATEVHSSQPAAGELAVAFVVASGAVYREAVYGRSYWRLRVIDGLRYVEVTWRNKFLIEPVDLLSGAVAYIPLGMVVYRWNGVAPWLDEPPP